MSFGTIIPPSIPLVAKTDIESCTDLQAASAMLAAERHFQLGKFHLKDEQPDAARKEFDQAIEALMDIAEDSPDRLAADKRLEELVRQIHRYDLEGLGAGINPDSAVYVTPPLSEILDMTFPVDPRLKDRTLAVVQAASSQLPLVVNDAVSSYITYFTSPRGSQTFLYGMKRAGRYEGMIRRVFAEEGIPQELIHLAQAESAFQPTALSWAKAAGMWQFVRFRGKEYGLVSSPSYDDRLDPEKATRAAAHHLRDLYQQLGDWYLAMAAYNCGPYCVERAVQRTGYADFWELRRRNVLPRETANYVPAILAMTIIAKNPRAYGLELPEPDQPLVYDTIVVPVPTHLGLVADAADRPAADLRELNPALIKGIAPAGYALRVPKGSAQRITSAIDLVPVDKRNAWRLHKVSEGDTVASIARRYSTLPNLIVSANPQKLSPTSSTLADSEEGEILLIPQLPKVTPPTRKSATAAKAPARRAPAAVASRARATVRTAASKTAAKPNSQIARR